MNQLYNYQVQTLFGVTLKLVGTSIYIFDRVFMTFINLMNIKLYDIQDTTKITKKSIDICHFYGTIYNI